MFFSCFEQFFAIHLATCGGGRILACFVLNSPDSISPMVCLVTPAFLANSDCDISSSILRNFNFKFLTETNSPFVHIRA